MESIESGVGKENDCGIQAREMIRDVHSKVHVESFLMRVVGGKVSDALPRELGNHQAVLVRPLTEARRLGFRDVILDPYKGPFLAFQPKQCRQRQGDVSARIC